MRDFLKYLLIGVIGIGIGIGIGAGIWLSSDDGHDDANDQFPENGFVELPVGNHGYLTGIVENGVAKFLGIPYAPKPIRFEQSEMGQFLPNYNFSATHFGSNCYGAREDLNKHASEDCLNLNIYVSTKALQKSDAIPVLFYIHGGAFFTGNNTQSFLMADTLVSEHDLIVVTINYRLAASGFWFNPNMTEIDGHEANWGILDQQEALKWVNNFIHNFNGDSTRITLSGCSAGGQSVLIHSVVESSWPYFHQAIPYSAPFGIPYFGANDAERIYNSVAKCLNCDHAGDMTCLRTKSMDEIYNCTWTTEALFGPDGAFAITRDNQELVQLAEPYAPVYGTKLLAEEPFYLIQNGQLRNSPLLMMYATNEGEEFIESVFYPNGIDDSNENRNNRVPRFLWDPMIDDIFDKGDEFAGNAVKVKKAFPCDQKGVLPSPLDECGEAAEEWLTQFTWACTTRRALNNLATHSNYKENVYHIEHDLFYPEKWPVPGWHRQCYSKSCHCIAEYYLFGSYELDENLFFSDEEIQFGKLFRQLHYDFYSMGKIPDFLGHYIGDNNWFKMNKSEIKEEPLYEAKCDMFDSIDLYLNV